MNPEQLAADTLAVAQALQEGNRRIVSAAESLAQACVRHTPALTALGNDLTAAVGEMMAALASIHQLAIALTSVQSPSDAAAVAPLPMDN